MIEINRLSGDYTVRRLTEADVEEIYRLCQGNTLFYRYCEAEPTREQIRRDLQIRPPGVPEGKKYYVGFYQERELIAVMDLIDGFPGEEIGFIGFFMVSSSVQHHGVGSRIIREAAAYLKATGKEALRLGMDKGNPQATSFWKKNGFQIIKEVERDGAALLLAEKML